MFYILKAKSADYIKWLTCRHEILTSKDDPRTERIKDDPCTERIKILIMAVNS